jgi:hypothetical protein
MLANRSIWARLEFVFVNVTKAKEDFFVGGVKPVTCNNLDTDSTFLALEMKDSLFKM